MSSTSTQQDPADQEKPETNQASTPLNEFLEYQRTVQNIRYLSHKYRKAHEWLPRLAVESPGMSGEQALIAIRERLSELRNSRRRYKQKWFSALEEKSHSDRDLKRPMPVSPLAYPSWQSDRSEHDLNRCCISRDKSIQLAQQFDWLEQYQHEIDDYQGVLELIQKSEWRIEGIAKASGFSKYERHLTADMIYSAFIPYGPKLDFSGATGMQFIAEMEGDFSVFLGLVEFVCYFNVGGVLQYTLPEAPWDGIVQWQVNQKIDVPLITIDADWGCCALQSVSGQFPEGEDFPAEYSAYYDAFCPSYYPFPDPVIHVYGDEFSGGPYAIQDTFRHGFFVSKGKKPRVYIGIHIILQVTDGSVSIRSGYWPSALHKCPDGSSGLSYTYIRL